MQIKQDNILNEPIILHKEENLFKSLLGKCISDLVVNFKQDTDNYNT